VRSGGDGVHRASIGDALFPAQRVLATAVVFCLAPIVDKPASLDMRLRELSPRWKLRKSRSPSANNTWRYWRSGSIRAGAMGSGWVWRASTRCRTGSW
jgi:hypothetical protein